MPQEIEKKFLVRSTSFKDEAFRQTRITQGYLSSVPERTVRIRIRGDKGYITVKGVGNETGASRYEWEKEIALHDAEALLQLCEPGIIDKTRYEVMAGDHLYEVDEFYGENKGLILAEVELTDEKEDIEKPVWLGQEVTGDNRYYNSMLMKQPYCRW